MASRQNLRSASVAGFLALALFVAGCSSSSDPDTWVEADETGKIEENFLRACSEGADGQGEAADVADYCGCSYDGLRQEYADDFQGFLDVNSELGSEPTAIPANVRAIYDGCAELHLAS